MREIEDIVALSRQPDVRVAVLATLVSVDGSSYRKPGACMALTPDGRRAGSISGGCLERDVEEHAQRVFVSRRSTVIRYDTRGDADPITGTGTGCHGVIEILLQWIDCSDPDNPIAAWADGREARWRAAMATVIESPDEDVARVGDRTWVMADGRVNTTLTDAPLAAAARRAAEEALRDVTPRVESCETSAGPGRLFVRGLPVPLRLLICGGGDDAKPLVRIGRELGWSVWVFDHREAFAVATRFPQADRIVLASAGELPAELSVDARTVAIVMNHNLRVDTAWVRTLAARPLAYLGALGSRRRTLGLLQVLLEEGALQAADAARVFSPAGLDIGAETPEEIALAMIAEIQAIVSGRAGGPLRHRLDAIASTASSAASADAAPRPAAVRS